MYIPLVAIANACRGAKNFVQDGGLQELTDKIHAKRVEYEAKEAEMTREGHDGGSQVNTTMTVCTTCGADADARFCSKCGSSITSATCRGCGALQQTGGLFCNKCGANQSKSPTTLTSNTPLPVEDFAGFPVYYQQEFKKIKASSEAYKGKWNWAAFLFGGIWALTKGLWLPTLICFIGAIFTGGIVGVAYWFVFGARGNYMYYCKEIKHRDLPV
jgi:ribosomal protein L40E